MQTTRRRSSRRRSNEKSAAQIRRDIATQGTSYVDDGYLKQVLRPQVGPYVPPPWLVKDATVMYAAPPKNADAGQHKAHRGRTERGLLVLCDPFRLIGPTGTWVTLVDGVRGWVACEALAQESNQRAPQAKRKNGAIT